MTYPHIGNVGVNLEDNESVRPFLSGFIVRVSCPHPSNWRKEVPLEDFLQKYNVIGIHGIDTRKLTRNLRETGAKKGIISTIDHDEARLLKKVGDYPDIEGLDLVPQVTCAEPYDWVEGTWQLGEKPSTKPGRYRIAVYGYRGQGKHTAASGRRRSHSSGISRQDKPRGAAPLGTGRDIPLQRPW